MEKRKAKRQAKRLRVRFGDSRREGFPFTGLTNDVSSTGMFVMTSHGQRPGTRLHFEVSLPDQRPLFVEGVVARQVLVPPELRTVVRTGMGVRFLAGPELFGEIVPALKSTAPALPKEDPFFLTFKTEAEWKRAWETDFKLGAASVVMDERVPPDTIVTLTLNLAFAKKQLICEARVVRQELWFDGRTNHALTFMEPAETVATLQATFAKNDTPTSPQRSST
ncbi:MAG TPA: PilZ domain-containing protein [Archangium sp.]